MDYGIKISKEGKSITSTDPLDYIFSSQFSSVKVVQEPPSKAYQTVVVGAGSSQTVTIAHNLGFIPLVMVFTELNPGSGRWYSSTAVGGPDDLTQITVENVENGTYVDSTNVYIKYTNSTGSSMSVKYYYYIFGDAGS